MIWTLIFILANVSVGWLAWRIGSPSERQGAMTLFIALGLSLLLTDAHYVGPDVGILIVDSALLLGLGLIAMRGEAFWPLWACGFQAGALLVHVAAAVLPHLKPAVYVETMTIWSFAVLLSLACGCLFERREARR